MYDPLNGLNCLVKSEDFKQEPIESETDKNDAMRINKPNSLKEDVIKKENGFSSIKSEENENKIQVWFNSIYFCAIIYI